MQSDDHSDEWKNVDEKATLPFLVDDCLRILHFRVGIILRH